MANSKSLLIFLALVALLPGSPEAAHSEQKAASSKLIVEKSKITFDPKTCTEGRGLFYWGLGSAAVQILGHRDGHCVFEYTAEVEMGYSNYLVRVPVNSGPVTIEAGTIKQGPTSYPGIITSFPLEKAKLIRRGILGGAAEVAIGETGEFVFLIPSERRSEMEPLKGDKVKFRFKVFDSAEFKRDLSQGIPDPTVEFVVGDSEAWPWIETAMEHMTVGDRRQVHVPVKVAGGATKWLPNPSDAKFLYLEMSLVSLERGNRDQ